MSIFKSLYNKTLICIRLRFCKFRLNELYGISMGQMNIREEKNDWHNMLVWQNFSLYESFDSMSLDE